MLDSDLALLYGVSVKRLNEAVKRNKERFPLDFIFQLRKSEVENLRYQFGTANSSKRRFVFEAIKQLMEPPEEALKPKIGFV